MQISVFSRASSGLFSFGKHSGVRRFSSGGFVDWVWPSTMVQGGKMRGRHTHTHPTTTQNTTPHTHNTTADHTHPHHTTQHTTHTHTHTHFNHWLTHTHKTQHTTQHTHTTHTQHTTTQSLTDHTHTNTHTTHTHTHTTLDTTHTHLTDTHTYTHTTQHTRVSLRSRNNGSSMVPESCTLGKHRTEFKHLRAALVLLKLSLWTHLY